MAFVWTVLGVACVALVARDVFHQIFHPSGRGLVSELALRGTFAATRAVSGRLPSALKLSGPLGVLFSILLWTALLAVGFALIYLPHLPDAFRLATGLDPAGQAQFGDALYLSLVTLATLGYGDISPTSMWLRILTPVEALLGFALLTAGLSWVLSLYPVLGRRRALAHQVELLASSDAAALRRLLASDPSAATVLILNLSSEVSRIRTDLVQFPSSHYFHSPQEETSLPHALVQLKKLADLGRDAGGGPREASAILNAALESVATKLRSQLPVNGGSPEEVLRSYARRHRREPAEI